MAADPEAVTAAADHYADYQANRSTMSGIQPRSTPRSATSSSVFARARPRSASKAEKALKCSDGEGGCASAADQAADKATLQGSVQPDHRRVRQGAGEHRPAGGSRAQVAARRIAAAQRDLGPAQYGSAAKSSANRQLLAAYHNAVLMEVEQLLALSEDSAKWAATRYKDRTINFIKID